MKVDIKNITGYSIKERSLKIKDAINQRSTASFTVLDPEAKLHFNQGNPIEISDYSNEISIYKNYNPLYDTKARISYIKGKTIANLLQNSDVEKTNTEYLLYTNLTNLVDINGIGFYTISFDLYTEISGDIKLYFNPNTMDRFKYISVPSYFIFHSTTNYERYSCTFEFKTNPQWGGIIQEFQMSFYGTYETGVIPHVKNVLIQLGSVGNTDYVPFGFTSVTPTIQGIALGKTLRGLDTIYDEYKNGVVSRKFVEVNLWEYGVIGLDTTLNNTYRFIFNDFTINNSLMIGKEGLINSFPYLYSASTDTRHYYYDSSALRVFVEKSIIDDIIAQGTITYEWKLQEWILISTTYEWELEEYDNDLHTWSPVLPPQLQWSATQPTADVDFRWVVTGNEQNTYDWQDVSPQQLQWSETTPSADSGFRWVKTGNVIYGTSEIDALLIYLEAENIQGVFELAKYTEEYVKPIIFDMEYEQPLVIDSIDTTIKALIDYKLYFSGFIDDSDEKALRGTKAIDNLLKEQMTHKISCKDNHYLADKRLIAKSYINMFCGDIVKDIISSKLADEFVIEGTIQQGEFMEEVVFNYIYINKALEKLAEASGFIWYIDYERKLDFMARDTVRNLIDITETDCSSVKVSLGNGEYRNNQYIKGGKALTDLLLETFKSDGATKNYVTAFPIGEKPAIKVDGIVADPNDIGIRGVDPSEDVKDKDENIIEYAKKWFWSKDSNTINQNNNDLISPVIDVGIIVSIEYYGLFDIVVATPDLAEIDKRSELESNSGIVEQIEEELDNNSITISLNSAIAKLNKYAVDGKVITIKTRRKDLESGQIIHAIFPNHDIDEDVLIYSINVSLEENTVIWHEATLIVGPEVISFYKMFEKIQSSTTRVIRENIDELQALVVPFEFSKTWLEVDTANIFRELYPSETLYPSTTLYPMFEPTDRVKYMEILNGTTVVARVYRIKQTTETNEIVTLFYIKNNQANGDITSLKFYGGGSATDVIGSGVLIDTQTFNYTKTMLEILTIFKTDIKGW